MDKPVRINSRISKRANDWLDKKAEEMALTKSALINLAIEDYIKQTDTLQGLPVLLKALEEQGVDMSDLLK